MLHQSLQACLICNLQTVLRWAGKLCLLWCQALAAPLKDEALQRGKGLLAVLPFIAL